MADRHMSSDTKWCGTVLRLPVLRRQYQTRRYRSGCLSSAYIGRRLGGSGRCGGRSCQWG